MLSRYLDFCILVKLQTEIEISALALSNVLLEHIIKVDNKEIWSVISSFNAKYFQIIFNSIVKTGISSRSFYDFDKMEVQCDI